MLILLISPPMLSPSAPALISFAGGFVTTGYKFPTFFFSRDLRSGPLVSPFILPPSSLKFHGPHFGRREFFSLFFEVRVGVEITRCGSPPLSSQSPDDSSHASKGPCSLYSCILLRFFFFHMAQGICFSSAFELLESNISTFRLHCD